MVIETEGNATLTGAVIAGQQVSGYVRGNLTIESLQDTSTYDSRQQTAGAGVSVCVPPFCVGTSSGSVSFSNARANGQYASVTEQSGIQAGDGGYQLTVDGNTHLKGGVISSSAKASEDGKNSLVTGTLSKENLLNVDSYEASGVSISLGAGGLGGKSPGLSATPGYSHSSGNQQSQTISSISAGTLVVTNDQAQRNLTGQSAEEAVASIDRSAVTGTDLSNALNKNWDGKELEAKTQAELLITRTALPLISNEIAGQMNQQALDLRNQAQQLPDSDPAKQQLLAEAARYDEGGTYRIAAHTVLGGLGGGLSGAAGAGAAAAAAPSLNDLQSTVQQQLLDTGSSQTTASLVSRLVSGATATAIGSGAGSAAGGSLAGALTGANADFNNRQLHPEEKQKLIELQRGRSQADQQRLADAACYRVQCAEQMSDDNPLKANALASQQRGAGYLSEQQELASTGLFRYSTVDVFNDRAGRVGDWSLQQLASAGRGAVNLGQAVVAEMRRQQGSGNSPLGPDDLNRPGGDDGMPPTGGAVVTPPVVLCSPMGCVVAPPVVVGGAATVGNGPGTAILNSGDGEKSSDGNALKRPSTDPSAGVNIAPNVRAYPDGSIRTPDGKFVSPAGQPAPGTANAANYADFLRQNGVDVVGTEIEVEGPLGVRKYDIAVRNSDGSIYGIEVKSGGAKLTRYQEFSDMYVNQYGTTGRGRIAGQPVTGSITIYLLSGG